MADEHDSSNNVTKVESESKEDDSNPRNIGRNNLVAAATIFLNSKKIKDNPSHLKKAFLERKGLTSEEISTAFSLAESLANQTTPGHVPPSPAANEESFVKKVRGFVFSTIAFTGTALAIFEIFQRYISPWLTSGSRDWQERVVDGQVEVNESIASLVTAVDELKNQVAEKKVEDSFGTDMVVNEIKEDLRTLKSLMLSRNQFPSIPPTRPLIPSWQLETKKANGRDDLLEANKETFQRPKYNCTSASNDSEHCNGTANDDEDDGDDDDEDDDEEEKADGETMKVA